MKLLDLAYIQLKNKNKNLYVFLEKGGCAEFQYKFSFEVPEHNVVKFCFDDIFVVIDEINTDKLSGIEIDYKSTLMYKCFYIKHNPYEAENCKCGISFK